MLGALALLAAPLFGLFFRDPRATGVIRVLVFYFPLLAVGQVLDVELRKELRFGKRFVPELARTLAKAVIGIALAVIGAGYWSLVAAHVVGAAAWSAALLAIVPWRPRRIFDREEAKRLFGYGKHMVAVAVLVAISLRADHLVVGRFLGAGALGVYTIAFALPAFVFQASSGLSQVLFPAYAKLERDRERLRSAALRTLRLAAAVFVPAGAGMGAGRGAAGRGRVRLPVERRRRGAAVDGSVGGHHRAHPALRRGLQGAGADADPELDDGDHHRADRAGPGVGCPCGARGWSRSSRC